MRSMRKTVKGPSSATLSRRRHRRRTRYQGALLSHARPQACLTWVTTGACDLKGCPFKHAIDFGFNTAKRAPVVTKQSWDILPSQADHALNPLTSFQLCQTALAELLEMSPQSDACTAVAGAEISVDQIRQLPPLKPFQAFLAVAADDISPEASSIAYRSHVREHAICHWPQIQPLATALWLAVVAADQARGDHKVLCRLCHEGYPRASGIVHWNSYHHDDKIDIETDLALALAEKVTGSRLVSHSYTSVQQL
mmetsp:Transcript_34732/g.79412  ORF Transcript_34732/g.79412 Transcript_34732/m.79412 type:complete len:253 (-) Transcript_34732:43-801(-)